MPTQKESFQLLKQEVAAMLRKSYPACPEETQLWKVKDILNFQSDLEEKVNGRVSEKWIYTHLKGSSDKLPRTDILDMLSAYVNKSDWDSFISYHISSNQKGNFSGRILILPLVLILGVAGFYNYTLENHSKQLTFCFVDAERNELVDNADISIIVLDKTETPRHLKADSQNCFSITTNSDILQFVVISPYYKSDTISRNTSLVEKNYKELIGLRTNDYALMIHIFSNSEIVNWKKRRNQLNDMIDEDARIFQIFENEKFSIDMLNKWDFINKLSTPTKSLKNVQIIETVYRKGKIILLRFKQLDDEN